MDRIPLAIVGCGGMGGRHLLGLPNEICETLRIPYVVIGREDGEDCLRVLRKDVNRSETDGRGGVLSGRFLDDPGLCKPKRIELSPDLPCL